MTHSCSPNLLQEGWTIAGDMSGGGGLLPPGMTPSCLHLGVSLQRDDCRRHEWLRWPAATCYGKMWDLHRCSRDAGCSMISSTRPG